MRKCNYVILVFFLAVLSPITYAQDAKLHLRDFTPRYTITSFKVYGKCRLCTFRILNALKAPGIKPAFWDKEEQQLTVQYDQKKIRINQIDSLLAAAGHDTDKMKAKEEVFDALPVCCHYRNILSNLK